MVGGELEFRVLGALEVLRGGVPMPLPSQVQRALLARLLMAGGRVVSADELVDDLWKEPPQLARHALHTNVSRLRARLGDGSLVTRPPGYLLDIRFETVDSVRFEDGLRRAEKALEKDPADALALFDEALGLWRGPAYAEFAGSFARGVAGRLDELRLAARESRCEAALGAGLLDRALAELSELASAHPLRERPHGLLRRASSLADRRSQA